MSEILSLVEEPKLDEHNPDPISPVNEKRLREAFELWKAKEQELTSTQLLLRAVNAERDAARAMFVVIRGEVADDSNAPLKHFELKEEPNGELHFVRKPEAVQAPKEA